VFSLFLFHPSFHLVATAKLPQSSQLTRRGASLGDESGDGKRAVATPLFGSKRRPPVPFGFRAASPCSRVATARFT